MKAIQVNALDGPAAVALAEVAEPSGQVIIDVHYAGVTFPDLLLTRGQYQIRPDLPFVPGSEVSGIVREAPADSGVQPGDAVAAFPGLGGFAQTVACDPRMVFALPQDYPLDKAAALPMNYLTVDFALRRRGRLAPGETVLVQGAAGGVGTAAIQMAKAMGAHVIGVVSTESKIATATAAGADEVALPEGFRETVGQRVDLVVDPVGGQRFTDSLRSLRPEGRLLVIGFTAGDIPTVKVNRLLLNNITVMGVGWGAFWMPQPQYLQDQWAHLRQMLDRLDPPVGAVYDLADAAQALTALDERRVQGKALLKVR